jgi:hypothetical protein
VNKAGLEIKNSRLSPQEAPGRPLASVPIPFSMTAMGSGDALDLPYRVEQWDDTYSRVEELIALLSGITTWRWLHSGKQ